MNRSQFEAIRDVPNKVIVQRIDALEQGHVRIETRFRYPDGSAVDLFLHRKDDLIEPRRLSDLGQTMAWLLDMQVRPWLSKKRQRLLEDAIAVHEVRLNGGALEREVADDLSDIEESVLRLGQACLRVSDLHFTRRVSAASGIAEEVEEVIADAGFEYETNVELPGAYGKPILVDFLVHGQCSRSALIGLSAANPSTAHNAANEVFRRWHDLAQAASPESRITVVDDRSACYRDDDLVRLEAYSLVIPLSEGNALKQAIAA